MNQAEYVRVTLGEEQYQIFLKFCNDRGIDPYQSRESTYEEYEESEEEESDSAIPEPQSRPIAVAKRPSSNLAELLNELKKELLFINKLVKHAFNIK